MSTTDNSIRNEIKSYIAASGWSLVDIVAKMNDSRPADEQTTPQNISNKLTRGTIKYSEVKEIAEIIGFKVVWVKE
jgi:hypothetical protein